MFFLGVGLRKLAGAPMWVTIFEQLGAGQWFRYLTGLLQVGGALLLLAPRTFFLGIGVLACTMGGAIAAWVLVLHEPRSAILPAVVLSLLVMLTMAVRWSGASRRPD